MLRKRPIDGRTSRAARARRGLGLALTVRVLFVTHYFHPEVGAPQTRILETARLLVARGHSVTVLTGFPHYPDGIVAPPYRGRLFQREILDGIRVVRSAVYPAPNRGFARRLADHGSFALSALVASLTVGRVDAVVAETPPLFTAVSAVLIARARRTALLLNVADLWPASAVQLGVLRNRAAIRLAEALERFAYRNASIIAVPTPGMRAILLRSGEAEDKVMHLPNAVDVRRFRLGERSPNGTTRIVYCGTVGMAQGVGTLIDAVRTLCERGEAVEAVIAGDGAEREELERHARALGLSAVRFAGRVPRERVPDLLASADVAVLSLRDLPLFEDALPSKMLEYMAAARPVVAAASGQVAEVLAGADAGVACPPEDPEALAEAIHRVASDPENAARMGRNGRRYVEQRLSREAFVDRLERALERIAGDGAEAERVRAVYRSYESSPRHRRAWRAANRGNRLILSGLCEAVGQVLADEGCFPVEGTHALDVGCGRGDLLRWLLDNGAAPGSLHGIDLLEDRVAAARAAIPGLDARVADARALPFESGSADAVLLSTVLSSVVGRSDRVSIAEEALRVLRPGGVVVCYDARVPNPLNRQVRAITRRELRRLFPGLPLQTRSMTLLPPLARRLGPATATLYPKLVRLPPLRTHTLAVVRPQIAYSRSR